VTSEKLPRGYRVGAEKHGSSSEKFDLSRDSSAFIILVSGEAQSSK